MERTNYFGGVDVVRFLSALIVVGFHMLWLPWFRHLGAAEYVGPYLPSAPAGYQNFGFGWVGVEIFFVISGIVIANSSAGLTPIAYANNRICRLYPAVGMCATIGLGAHLAVGRFDGLLADYIRSMSLIVPGDKLSPVYWTLTVEIAFYVVVLLWMIVVRRRDLQPLALILILCSGLYLLGRMTGWLGFPSGIEIGLLLRHGVFFGIGIFLYIRTKRRLSRWEIGAVAAAALLGLFEIVLTADEQGVGRFAPALVWSIALCLIILATSKSGSMQSLPDKAKGAVRTIGLMTYPVYLIHYDFGGLCLRELYALGISVWPAVAIAVLTVLGVSYGIVAFAEPAIRRHLRNVLERTESRWQ